MPKSGGRTVPQPLYGKYSPPVQRKTRQHTRTKLRNYDIALKGADAQHVDFRHLSVPYKQIGLQQGLSPSVYQSSIDTIRNLPLCSRVTILFFSRFLPVGHPHPVHGNITAERPTVYHITYTTIYIQSSALLPRNCFRDFQACSRK